MNILLISEWFPPHSGGMESILYNLIINSAGDKYIVYAPFIRGCRKFDSRQDFEIIRSLAWSSFIGARIWIRLLLIWMIIHSVWIIRRRKIDIVFFGSLHLYMGIWSNSIKLFFNKPCFAFIFGEEIEKTLRDSRAVVRLLARFVILAMKRMDRLIAGSNYTVDKLISWGVPPDRIIKNFPCVDLRIFRPGLETRDILKYHGIESKRIILTVARLEKRKGIDLVIRAFPDILRYIPDAVYLIVGSGTQERYLHVLVKELGLSDKVIFVGNIYNYEDNCDLARYYNTCDVFIMANRVIRRKNETEGFGIVFLEANACGKPVIGGRSGGTSDAIVDKVTGLLIDSEDKKQIIEAVVTLLTDRIYAETLGRNGRLRAEREFTWSRYVNTIRKEALRFVYP